MKFNIKGFTSILLALAFIFVGFSGIMLYASPKGRVAYWTNWKLFAVSKEGWQAIHVNVAILFIVASGFHLYINWPIFLSYIKVKTARSLNLKKEMALAFMVSMLFFVGSLADNFPLLSLTMEINGQIQDFWENKAPKAPAPHAEEFSVARIARTIDLPVEDVMTTLHEEGFGVEDRSMSMHEIADNYGVAPSDVYAAITKHYGELKKTECSGGKGKCARPKPMGKMTDREGRIDCP